MTRPSRAWKAALVGAYGIFVVMIFGAGLLGPTIMAVLPLLAAYGLGVLPWVHERASAPAQCRSCGKIVPASAMAPVRVRPLVSAPARAA
ncbi:MAG: hypothetical protein H6712_30160 [Myxococcales bacterium]|nr:hypothetical protein [Myxococcales bacterium]MCB9718152.1 hypothetical protein [Myxococcales bacterium]